MGLRLAPLIENFYCLHPMYSTAYGFPICAMNKEMQHNLPVAVRLAGVLNVDALAAAYQYVVNRHETLRTTFAVTMVKLFK